MHLTSTHDANPRNLALRILSSNLKGLREGLEPEVLAYSFRAGEDRSIETVPAHPRNKINVKQDGILRMKFTIDISK